MGRYTYSLFSPHLSLSDEEIIAGIVRVEPQHDPTPPDVHITPSLADHLGNTIRLDHGDNVVDDIVASTVDINLETSRATSTARLQIDINSIHVFIVRLIISVTASTSRSLAAAQSRFFGVEQANITPPVRIGRRGPGRALGQFMP
ncbi:unnamed protein product [Rhizoctonia solani]|uniref:Uncharacterized protein n=1 Tax=Rhizoctonia solani TaxID=456999 RepID=A0A8H3HRY6_9AGAM|nr:unnamed protein product [Rhizoctonia solani]